MSENIEKNAPVYPIINIFQQEKKIERHHHVVFEFFYLKKGYVNFEIGGKSYKLSTGSVVFIQPLEVHSVKSIGNDSFEYCSLVFDSSVFGFENNPCREFFDSVRLKRFVELSDKILNHFVLLCDSSNKKTPGYEILQTTLLFDILSYLIITNQYETVALLRKQTKYNISAIDIAIEYIKDNFADNIELQDVLKLTNYSRSHFIRLFKEHTGMNLVEYINKYRIEKACLELIYSKKNITEIATEFGFNNIQYFSRVFKQYMNCTPKQYQMKGKNSMKPNPAKDAKDRIN